MSWPEGALGDVVRIARTGISPEQIEAGTTYVGLEHIDGAGDFAEVPGVEAGELRSTKFRFSARQILFGKLRPYLKKTARPDFEGICSTDILPLEPTKDIDRDYLFHVLRRQQFVDEVTSLCSGANLPRISPKVLASMRIPVPPLVEQRRIAAILDKADALRAKRREAIAKLDQLLQSVFLDMFGDPVTNPKRWPVRPISKLAKALRDGPFGSNLKSSHYVAHGVRVIRLQNIGVWKFLEGDVAYISQDHFKSLPRNHCVAGDVLIGTLGDPNLRACILPSHISPALNKADCLMFRVQSETAVAEYVCGLLNTPSLILNAQNLALGQTRLRISMGRLKELQVPVPPILLQQTFAQAVERIAEQARFLQHGADQMETLFASLQHRAFTGTL